MEICLGGSTKRSDGVDLLRGSSGGGHLGVPSLFLGISLTPHGSLDKEPAWETSIGQ